MVHQPKTESDGEELYAEIRNSGLDSAAVFGFAVIPFVENKRAGDQKIK